jgi:hypothetical protein
MDLVKPDSSTFNSFTLPAAKKPAASNIRSSVTAAKKSITATAKPNAVALPAAEPAMHIYAPVSADLGTSGAQAKSSAQSGARQISTAGQLQ